MAEANIATISDCRFTRIVPTEPHSLNALRNEYPELGATWTVMHQTPLLLELIESGRLNVEKRLSYRATHHDPCHLGRFNGEYEGPRRMLETIGCVLVEMPRNRDNSFCCDPGGGPIWIPDSPGQERLPENRTREAIALGDVELFVLSCPKNVATYADAIKTTGSS